MLSAAVHAVRDVPPRALFRAQAGAGGVGSVRGVLDEAALGVEAPDVDAHRTAGHQHGEHECHENDRLAALEQDELKLWKPDWKSSHGWRVYGRARPC